MKVKIKMGNYRKKVTTKMIKDYLEQKYQIRISHDCYIYDVKDKHNLLKDKNGNVRHNSNRKIKCPKSLEPKIEDAFRHYGMIL